MANLCGRNNQLCVRVTLRICTFFLTVVTTLVVKKGLQSKKAEEGFSFFAELKAGLDYLIRTNIDNRLQGRAWGLIGLISQLGYVAAYAISGLLADYIFTPLLLEGGALSENVGKILGTGPGRGIGLLIVLAGVLLCVTSGILLCMKSIRRLEDGGAYES